MFSGVVATTDVAEACKGVNVAVMVGGFPRKEGMERKDVMSKNVSIYKSQASALEQYAAPNCKVCYLAFVCTSRLTFSTNQWCKQAFAGVRWHLRIMWHDLYNFIYNDLE